MPKQYSHPAQSISGDTSTTEHFTYEDDRQGINAPANYDPNASAQFVPNPAGIGPRSGPKRSTLIRTQRLDASTEDLLHDGQHKQEYPHPSANLYAPQQIRQPSTTITSRTKTNSSPIAMNYNIRPPLIHGVPGSQNSSGHDSGLSSGGASFDPEQHHLYNLGNTLNPIRSATPSIDAYEVPPAVPLPKRKSLPSIVKTLPGDYKIDETARSSGNLKEKETFIIENGIRKRVTAQAPTYTESGSIVPQATVMTSSSGSPVLARRIILESIDKLDKPKLATTAATGHTGGNKRGSMPTVVNIARNRQEMPSRTSMSFSSLSIFPIIFV